MRKLSTATKAQIKMDSVIWEHGRKKAKLTETIKNLGVIDLKDHPDVKKVIALLTTERERLKKVELF